MGLSTIKVGGADTSVDNISGTNYTGTLQVSDSRCLLHKISFSPLTGMAADAYAWIYDVSAGTTSTKAPKIVRLIATGLADTWDFNAGGSLFLNGVYIVLATSAPTNADTDPSSVLSGNNQLIIKADIRKV